jgi:hypothetical protein
MKDKEDQMQDVGGVWFPATFCQAKVWLPQFSWHVFGFCHTLACNILFSVWPICHRVIVVAKVWLHIFKPHFLWLPHFYA